MKKRLLAYKAAGWTWIGLVLAVCASAVYSDVQPRRVEDQKPDLVWTYYCVWNDTGSRVNMAWVAERVAKLSPERTPEKADEPEDVVTPEEREKVWRELEEKLGLSKEIMAQKAPRGLFDLEDAEDRERAAYLGGLLYLRDLRSAVEFKVPIILRKPSAENAGRRDDLIRFLNIHPGFLPLLKTVAANSEEDYVVRCSALRAIACIPDEGVLPCLIERLYEREHATCEPKYVNEALTRAAHNALRALTNEAVPWVEPPEELQKKYRAWWEANKDTWHYPRGEERSRLFLRWQ